MLSELLRTLKEAIKNNDKQQKSVILGELKRLGMDAMTALILASDNAIMYDAPRLKGRE